MKLKNPNRKFKNQMIKIPYFPSDKKKKKKKKKYINNQKNGRIRISN